MQDIRQLLKQKEEAINQVRREVQALRFVSPWLNLNANPPPSIIGSDTSGQTAADLKEAMRTAAPLLMDDTDHLSPEIRNRLVEASELARTEQTGNRITRHLKRIASPFGRTQSQHE